MSILLDFSSINDIFHTDWDWNASATSWFINFSNLDLMFDTAQSITTVVWMYWNMATNSTPLFFLPHLFPLCCLSPPPPCALSFYIGSVLTSHFLSSLSPSLLHPFPLLLGASILVLIVSFVWDYLYRSLFCCISGCLLFFFSAF